MKVFICGDKSHAEDFENAERLLRQSGHIPISPLKLLQALPEEISNSDFAVITFEVIRICEAVYLISGWEGDLFARMELAHAKRLEREIWNETNKEETIA